MIIVNGERMVMADTGATHELRGVTSFSEIKGESSEVNLETATGNQPARMQDDIVYVEGQVQGLFPLVTYVETLGLKVDWNPKECKLVLPGGHGEIPLHRTGRAIYLSEKNADELQFDV